MEAKMNTLYKSLSAMLTTNCVQNKLNCEVGVMAQLQLSLVWLNYQLLIESRRRSQLIERAVEARKRTLREEYPDTFHGN